MSQILKFCGLVHIKLSTAAGEVEYNDHMQQLVKKIRRSGRLYIGVTDLGVNSGVSKNAFDMLHSVYNANYSRYSFSLQMGVHTNIISSFRTN